MLVDALSHNLSFKILPEGETRCVYTKDRTISVGGLLLELHTSLESSEASNKASTRIRSPPILLYV